MNRQEAIAEIARRDGIEISQVTPEYIRQQKLKLTQEQQRNPNFFDFNPDIQKKYEQRMSQSQGEQEAIPQQFPHQQQQENQASRGSMLRRANNDLDPLSKAMVGGVNSAMDFVGNGLSSLAPYLQGPIMQGVLGAADQVGKNISSLMPYLEGPLMSKVAENSHFQPRIPANLIRDSLPSNIGRFLGEAATMVPMGMLSSAALPQIAGSALYGAAKNENNPLFGALLGGGTAGLLNAGRPAKGLWDLVMKDKSREAATLGKSQVKAAAEAAEAVSKEKFNKVIGENADIPVAGKAYDALLYDKDSPSYVGEYIAKKNSNIRRFHDQFIKNSTIDNAHKLQSVLGDESRRLSGLDADADVLMGRDLHNTREALINDMDNALGPELAENYRLARKNHHEEVEPYRTLQHAINKKKTDVDENISIKDLVSAFQETRRSLRNRFGEGYETETGFNYSDFPKYEKNAIQKSKEEDERLARAETLPYLHNFSKGLKAWGGSLSRGTSPTYYLEKAIEKEKLTDPNLIERLRTISQYLPSKKEVLSTKLRAARPGIVGYLNRETD